MKKSNLQHSRPLKPTIAAVAIVVFAWSVTGRPAGHASGDEQPVNVGLSKQLFVDDYIVAEKSVLEGMALHSTTKSLFTPSTFSPSRHLKHRRRVGKVPRPVASS